MSNFKEYVEKNSTIGDFLPNPEVAIDTIAGNYMKGTVRELRFEVFVHMIPMGRGVMNERVYKLKLMEQPDILSPEQVEPGNYTDSMQGIRALFDRGWVLKPLTKEDNEIVELIVKMFPGSATPATEKPDTVSGGMGPGNEKVLQAQALAREEQDTEWKNKLYGEQTDPTSGEGYEPAFAPTPDVAGKDKLKKKKKDKKAEDSKPEGKFEQYAEGPMKESDIEWAKKLYGEEYLSEGKFKMNLKDRGVTDLMDLKNFMKNLKDNNINWNQPKQGSLVFDTKEDLEKAGKLLK